MKASRRRRQPAWRPTAFRLQQAGVFYALAVVAVVFTLLTQMTGRPGFATFSNASNLLDQAAMDSILAVFMTVVLISGNFDLSIASTAALSSVTALRLSPNHNVLLVIVACLLCGSLIGIINGVLVQYVGINAFIVTLGTLTAVRGVVFLASGASSITANTGALHDMTVGFAAVNLKLIGVLAGLLAIGVGMYLRRRRTAGARNAAVLVVLGAIVAVVAAVTFPLYFLLTYASLIMLTVLLIVWLLLTFTVVGRRLHAVGSNAEAARLSGINVARYRIGAFMASGSAAAFVGLLFAGKYESMNPQALTGEELVVLTAAILGGTSLFGGVGSVVKSVIGALILTSLANGMNFQQINSAWQGVIEGAVLIVAAAAYTVTFRKRSTPPPPAVGAQSNASPPTQAVDRTQSIGGGS